VVGVIANRIGSERQGRALAQSLEARGLPPLLGAIPRGGFPSLPHRHLGLVSANAHNLSETILTGLADGFDRWIDLSNTLACLNDGSAMPTQTPLEPSLPSEVLSTEDIQPRTAPQRSVRVGIAWDEAFHFYYPDNLEALRSAGCVLVRFSPMNGQALPAGLSGLYLGGGYPEAYASELSNNRSMLASIRAFAASEKPIYAECGGLMYLSNGIVDRNGREYPMLGLLPCWTRMLEQRERLGYVEVTLREDSLLGVSGERVRGHEFHYSQLVGDPTDGTGWRRAYELRRPRSESATLEGFQHGRIVATYVHAHFASRPGAARRFRESCNVTTEKDYVS